MSMIESSVCLVSQSEVGGGGAAGVLLLTALSCSMDVRGQVLRHVVVAGGGASLHGLADGVCAEATKRTVRNLETADSRLQCLSKAVRTLEDSRITCAPSPFPRSNLAWIGASVFAANKVMFTSTHCSSFDAMFRTMYPVLLRRLTSRNLPEYIQFLTGFLPKITVRNSLEVQTPL